MCNSTVKLKLSFFLKCCPNKKLDIRQYQGVIINIIMVIQNDILTLRGCFAEACRDEDQTSNFLLTLVYV